MKKLIIGMILFFGILNNSFAYDISSTSFENSTSTTAQMSYEFANVLSDDGTTLLLLGFIEDRLFEYTLSTPFNPSTKVYTGRSHFISGISGTYRDISYKDGNLYIGDSPHLRRYSINSNLDLSSISFIESIDVGIAFEGLDISSDGMYFVTAVNGYIRQYNLLSPFVLTGFINSGNSISGLPSTTNGVRYSWNGDSIFYSSASNNLVVQYDLSTNFDISTNILFGTYAIPSTSFGINFSQDGGFFYLNMGTLGLYTYSNGGVFQSPGPPASVIDYQGYLSQTENGIIIDGFQTNNDALVSMAFQNTDTLETYISETQLFYTGGILGNIEWQNDNNWTFLKDNNYHVVLNFEFYDYDLQSNYWIDYIGYNDIDRYGIYSTTGTGFILSDINLTHTGGTYSFDVIDITNGITNSILGIDTFTYLSGSIIEINNYDIPWETNTFYRINGYYNVPGLITYTMSPYNFNLSITDVIVTEQVIVEDAEDNMENFMLLLNTLNPYLPQVPNYTFSIPYLAWESDGITAKIGIGTLEPVSDRLGVSNIENNGDGKYFILFLLSMLFVVVKLFLFLFCLLPFGIVLYFLPKITQYVVGEYILPKNLTGNWASAIAFAIYFAIYAAFTITIFGFIVSNFVPVLFYSGGYIDVLFTWFSSSISLNGYTQLYIISTLFFSFFITALLAFTTYVVTLKYGRLF